MIFSAYRRDDFADAESFALQLGMVLAEYPDAVVTDVTHPLTGIQRRSKFPPTIAEVVDACNAEVARRERIAKWKALGDVSRPRLEHDRPKENRANLFVPASNPAYQALVDKAANEDPLNWRWDETRPGIWVVFDWFENGRATASRETIDSILARLKPEQAEAAE